MPELTCPECLRRSTITAEKWDALQGRNVRCSCGHEWAPNAAIGLDFLSEPVEEKPAPVVAPVVTPAASKVKPPPPIEKPPIERLADWMQWIGFCLKGLAILCLPLAVLIAGSSAKKAARLGIENVERDGGFIGAAATLYMIHLALQFCSEHLLSLHRFERLLTQISVQLDRKPK